MMKLISKIIGTGITLSLCAFAPLQLSNYSGDWKISASESNFGGQDQETAAPAILQVKQYNDHIVIDRTFTGRPLMHEDFKLNGEVINSIPNNGDTKKIHVEADNEKLLVLSYFTSRQNDRDYAYSRKETWSLADGGKTLVIDRVTWFTKGQDGRDSVHAVYHK